MDFRKSALCSGGVPMPTDDDFKPKMGRGRARGRPVSVGRAYLNHVTKATNLARGGAASTTGKSKASGFHGSRIGRGAGVGSVLASRSGIAAYRQRRVIVKSRIVKLAGKGLSAATAHMRYIQRDGVTREGLPGELYSKDMDKADGRAFIARADGDRHQFRFIVAPEDGAQYDDLKDVTRRLMSRMEQDLNTKLDWVAVDHHNTGHPHTHIIVRGKDDLGKDLVIARDYITAGVRERATEIVSFDLGPRTDKEIDTRLQAEVTQDRFTSLDKTLLNQRDENGLVRAVHSDAFRQSLMAGRLNKLGDMKLAENMGHGQWRLDGDLEPTLRRLGERGDIIKTMARNLARADRMDVMHRLVIHDQDPSVQEGENPSRKITGMLVRRALSDEMEDRHYVVVEGIDGHAHIVEIGLGERTPKIELGAVVSVEFKVPSLRPADVTIVKVANANRGIYEFGAHMTQDQGATDSYVETHQRRLEAIRRATDKIERTPDGGFRIPPDYPKIVMEYERARTRLSPVTVTVLSTLSLDQQVNHNGATWLDRELTAKTPSEIAATAFGQDARQALKARQQWLIEQGLAKAAPDGQVNFPKGMFDTLTRREIYAAAGQLSKELGLNFTEAQVGARVEGTFRQTVNLASGKYALVENAKEFTLVPWKPALEDHIGKTVSGIYREGNTDWNIARIRGLGIS
jgi:type IV secretory pathway VirD2 relaxase